MEHKIIPSWEDPGTSNSARNNVRNELLRRGFKTWEEVGRLGFNEMMSMKGFGRKSIVYVLEEMDRYLKN